MAASRVGYVPSKPRILIASLESKVNKKAAHPYTV